MISDNQESATGEVVADVAAQSKPKRRGRKQSFRERYQRLSLWNKFFVWTGVATFVGLALSIIALYPNQKTDDPPKPASLLALHAYLPTQSDQIIKLTNSFLAFTNDPIHLPEDAGYLIAPVKDHTNVVLHLVLVNTSKVETIDAIESYVTISPELKWRLDPQWHKTLPSPHANWKAERYVTRVEGPLLPNTGRTLPPIHFEAGPNKHAAIFVNARSRNSASQTWAFWVTFPKVDSMDAELISPQVTKGELDRVNGTNKVLIGAMVTADALSSLRNPNIEVGVTTTLHELFQADFSNTDSVGSDCLIESNGKKLVTCEAKLRLDQAANAKFVTYYIPPLEAIGEACYAIIKLNDGLLAQLASKWSTHLVANALRPTYTPDAMVHSRNLYIYHETEIPEEERAFLESFAETHGVSVRFRGEHYRLARIAEASVGN